MKIIAFESFYADSHKYWLDQLIQYSQHEFEKFTLPGRHWKWRMHGAAITFANKINAATPDADLFLHTDMIDLAVFKALLKPKYQNIPILMYFHENQLTYPWNGSDPDVQLKRDRHYGFINYTSALAADTVVFNSHYHRNSFLNTLPKFLEAFPDFQNLETINEIEDKSSVIPIGMDLEKLEKHKKDVQNEIPVILWNHRWEFDKNPEDFFNVLFRLKEEGFAFKLIVSGKSYKNTPQIFNDARQKLDEEIIHWGYAKDELEYIKLLWSADILPVCSNQDFFGISVVEAMYCGCFPILPDRLSYPEHSEDQSLFYENSEELYSKLKSLIQRFPHLPNIDLNKIETYQWGRIIKDYDRIFDSLKQNDVKVTV